MMTANEIAREVDRLPVFPASVAALLARLRDPNVAARDVEAALRPDALLTARVLRLANSGYYRGGGEISTVKDAVVRLGLQTLFGLATSSGLAQVLPARLHGYGIDAGAFMSHSAAVAVFAERLARRYAADVERVAFTAGLLHDLGKLVISAFLAEQSEALRERLDAESMALLDVEHELLGTDHGEVGALVCERWNLPTVISAAARWHHMPKGAPTPETRRLCEVLHVADALTHAFGFSTDVGELQRRLEPEAVQALGIGPGGLEEVVAESVGQAQATIAMMGGELAAPKLAAVGGER